MSRDFEVGRNVTCEELTVSPVWVKFVYLNFIRCWRILYIANHDLYFVFSDYWLCMIVLIPLLLEAYIYLSHFSGLAAVSEYCTLLSKWSPFLFFE